MSYIYLKKDIPKKGLPPHKRILISLLFLGGFSFLSLAVFPIIKFQLEYSSKFIQIIDPTSSQSYSQNNVLGDSNSDYTQLSNWFVNTQENLLPVTQISDSKKSNYYLSIPKLKISDAVVSIGSMDLEKSLIQYPQTALPGQLGNTVVFGHSVLPQFFNSKNYLTIFSTLYKLEQGDEIYLKYDKSNYKYIVEEMFEVQPTNLSVLEQRFDDKTLTLITCSPPGTYLRRLIIKATLSAHYHWYNSFMNALSIDYGSKRIGIAISIKGIIQPLDVFQNNSNFLPQLKQVIADYQIDQIYVGISQGLFAVKTQKFVDELKTMLKLPIETVEEAVSTIEANQIYSDNRNPKKDYKKNIDAVAAAVILKRVISS